MSNKFSERNQQRSRDKVENETENGKQSLKHEPEPVHTKKRRKKNEIHAPKLQLNVYCTSHL